MRASRKATSNTKRGGHRGRLHSNSSSDDSDSSSDDSLRSGRSHDDSDGISTMRSLSISTAHQTPSKNAKQNSVVSLTVTDADKSASAAIDANAEKDPERDLERDPEKDPEKSASTKRKSLAVTNATRTQNSTLLAAANAGTNQTPQRMTRSISTASAISKGFGASSLANFEGEIVEENDASPRSVSRVGGLIDRKDKRRLDHLSPRETEEYVSVATVSNNIIKRMLAEVDPKKMDSLRTNFGGRDIERRSFPEIIRKQLPSIFPSSLTTEQIHNYLLEIFDEIDIDGTGLMSWESFTNFIIESGQSYRRSRLEDIKDYQLSTIKDTNRHSTIEKIKFLPTLGKLATCEADKTVKLFDVSSLAQVGEISMQSPAMDIAHCAPRNWIITARADGNIDFYHGFEGYSFWSRFDSKETQLSLVLPESREMMFTGSATGVIKAWSLENMKETLKFTGHTDSVMDLVLDPNEPFLYSASMDNTIRAWDLQSKAHKLTLKGHHKGIFQLCFSSEYNCLLSAGFEHHAFVWNPYSGRIIMKLQGHLSNLVGVQKLPDGPQVLTADVDGWVKVWDIRTGNCVQTFADPSGTGNGKMTSLTYCPPLQRVIGSSNKLFMFEYSQADDPHQTDAHPIRQSIYNPLYKSIITSAGKDFKVWDARSGNLVHRAVDAMPAEITSICLDDRKRKLIVGDHQGHLKVFSFINAGFLRNLTSHNAEISGLCYCTEPRGVFSASWDRYIRLHDDVTGHVVKQFTG
eukprot:TRINITY_DN7034_c0_g1_i2.p1 TRINITY_DN7034_c0_g1~~TRINITY_DN7034_c0_g1_i2.p1  ORF type:complete len:747 (+),score=130.92 TRINITY_DN7034_c0_g1_i2:56-2296(+)